MMQQSWIALVPLSALPHQALHTGGQVVHRHAPRSLARLEDGQAGVIGFYVRETIALDHLKPQA